MYTPLRPGTCLDLPLRHMHYRVRTWGQPQADTAPLVLLHGWMDVGASYQFVVDAFSEAFCRNRFIVAPDWRGFGHSSMPTPMEHYAFADYLADLEALLAHCVPDAASIDLVGHSMGGNIAMLYAGVRPHRIRRLVNLEGFGLPATQPAQAPARLAQWLDELQALRQGRLQLKPYASQAAVAERLRKTNPRLDADHALWLAGQWAAPDAQGQWHVLGDAAHKVVNPQLFRVDEMLAAYTAITAPVLAIEASQDSLARWWGPRFTLAQYHERLQSVADCRIVRIDDAGHMLHHDQPQQVAQHIETFLA